MIRRGITLAPQLQRRIITEEEPRATSKHKEMQHKLLAMEAYLHQDTVSFVRPTHMTLASAKFLNILLITKLNSVRSTMHVTCVSKQVSIKLTLVLRS